MSSPLTGNSTLTLNHETMVLAVQHYLETLVFVDGACPRVTGVNVLKEQYTGASSFRIELDGNEKSRTPEGTAE